MAIYPLKDIPSQALVGKFICAPSMLSFQDYGYPAIIEKVTTSRMVYRKLARGEWDSVANEWLVSPAVADDLTEGTRQCNLKSIDLVCDTAEEAIALFEYSRANRKKIEAMQAALLKDVRDLARGNQLPAPSYLAAK